MKLGRLLSMTCERPRCSHTPNNRDELAPFHAALSQAELSYRQKVAPWKCNQAGESLLWVTHGRTRAEHIKSASPPRSGHLADMPGRPLGAKSRRPKVYPKPGLLTTAWPFKRRGQRQDRPADP